MTQPTLLTVVLNYRTADMTLKAVAAALRETKAVPGDVVIVDNDSGDGSEERLRAEVEARGWPVRVIQSGRNGGFGAGNNVGIRAGLSGGARPDYVYILNSDAFPGPGAVQRLYEILNQDQTIGFAGSYIHGAEGDPHITAFRFPSIGGELEGAARFGPISRLLRHKRVPLDLPGQTRRVDWLAGASLMMRQDVLDQIGLFDERFFLYFEETDLCLRAARAGWPTLYVRDSEVAHIGSVSTGMKQWTRTPRYWFESRWHYYTKNHGTFYAVAATLAHLAGGLLWRARRVIQRKPPADPPHFLRDMLAHDLGALLPGRRPSPALQKEDA